MSSREQFTEKINNINIAFTKKLNEYKLFYDKLKMFEKIVNDYVNNLSNFVNYIDIKEKYFININNLLYNKYIVQYSIMFIILSR